MIPFEVSDSPLPTDGGASLGDAFTNPAVSGPIGAALAILGFIAQQYFAGRKDKREDKVSDRTSESGIVETTKEALGAARDQIAEMRKERAEDRVTMNAQADEINSLKDRLARAIRILDGLQEDKEELTRKLDGNNNVGSTQSAGRWSVGDEPALSQIPGTEFSSGPPVDGSAGYPDPIDGGRAGAVAGEGTRGRAEPEPGGSGPGRHRPRS